MPKYNSSIDKMVNGGRKANDTLLILLLAISFGD